MFQEDISKLDVSETEKALPEQREEKIKISLSEEYIRKWNTKAH